MNRFLKNLLHRFSHSKQVTVSPPKKKVVKYIPEISEMKFSKEKRMESFEQYLDKQQDYLAQRKPYRAYEMRLPENMSIERVRSLIDKHRETYPRITEFWENQLKLRTEAKES